MAQRNVMTFVLLGIREGALARKGFPWENMLVFFNLETETDVNMREEMALSHHVCS